MSDPQPMPPVDPLPPRRSRKAMLLGVVSGIGYFAVYLALNVYLPLQDDNARGALLIAPLGVLLVGAIGLSVTPRTSSFGAGLLISLGIVLLVGAGLCVALLSGAGSG